MSSAARASSVIEVPVCDAKAQISSIPGCHHPPASEELKTMTKDGTWESMVSRFDEYWTHAIEKRYTAENIYIDVGKETCPAAGFEGQGLAAAGAEGQSGPGRRSG
jgi:hypothetical protein